MIIYGFLLKINFDSCFIYLNIYIKKNFMYFIFFLFGYFWICFLEIYGKSEKYFECVEK